MGKEQLSIVITGHVDHGKSTVVGRMLAETGSLPEGKLEKIKKDCERNSKPFEYAFLLDALKDEQSQGITIDAARVFFKTQKRDYIIIDAPGHIEFLKNMVTGAARAEAAFLVIDADEGVQENSRRHGYILSMLGIRQICVVVNKMDLVDFDRKVYRAIVKKFTKFLKNLDVADNIPFVPVSGREGDNVAVPSDRMKWWDGPTFLEVLDNFKKEKPLDDLPLRIPVQDVYKFTNYGDARRIIAGSVATGTLKPGDELIFYPSGKRSKIESIETFNAPTPEAVPAGDATGFTLTEQIYVKRGDMAARKGDIQPQTGTVLRVNLFWLGRNPLEKGKDYFLKVGTEKVRMQLFDTLRVINSSSLNTDSMKKKVDRHEVAECVLTTQRAVSFDKIEDVPQTSRFVIVDDFEIAGGGIIREAIKDNQSDSRESVFFRNYKWDTSNISREERKARFNHKSAMILITGSKSSQKSDFAKDLEQALFKADFNAYYLGISNVVYGMDADLTETRPRRSGEKFRDEHLRRLAEIAHIMLDSGTILVSTAYDLTYDEKEMIKMRIKPEILKTVWCGEEITTNIDVDYHITEPSKDKVDDLLKEIRKTIQ